MNEIKELLQFAQEEARLLCNWWSHKMIDIENGGFLAQLSDDNIPVLNTQKSVILNTRILWTFSKAAIAIDSKYESSAKRAYNYIDQNFLDNENGGLFWSVDINGNVLQARKQIYAQAFGIYGMVAFYKVNSDPAVLERALQIFDLIENKSFDKENGGYIEAFSQDWQPIEDLRLSDKDANEAKTMNTHLHILEAYTALNEVVESRKVKDALERLINYFLDYFIDPKTFHLHLFFDVQWALKSEIISYGHDIEASWLLCEAAEGLKDKSLLKRLEVLAISMTDALLKNGVSSEGGIYNEREGKHLDDTYHWWPQAEAVVGFINAYQISKDSTYLFASYKTVDFIKKYLKDSKYGEWYWCADSNLKPALGSFYKAGPWKAPYHNVRMCLEIIDRLQSVDGSVESRY